MSIETVGLFYGGAGAAGIAARQLGLKTVFNFEPRKGEYLRTFNFNFKKEPFLFTSDSNVSEILKYHEDIIRADLIIGQPDCKMFSNLRTRKRSDEIFQGTQLWEFIYFMQFFQPLFFIVENLGKGVDALELYLKIEAQFDFMLKSKLKRDEDLIFKSYKFLRIDLSTEAFLPQSRKRSFFIGIRKDVEKQQSFKFNPPESRTNKLGVRSIIKDLEEPGIEKYIFNHDIPNHSLERIKGFKNLGYGQSYYGTQNNRRLDPEKLGYTITSHCTHHVHYKFNRTLTVRECARIQGFPDDFSFLGGKTSQYDQVGKSISPPVIKYIISQLISHFG